MHFYQNTDLSTLVWQESPMVISNKHPKVYVISEQNKEQSRQDHDGSWLGHEST